MRNTGFSAIWALDTEFRAGPGERPTPHCLVAYELLSGRVVRCWLADGAAPAAPPFAVGDDTLCVAYYSSAEWGCFLSLGWPLPVHVLDLYTEFRTLTNGRHHPHGAGLLGALLYFGLHSIEATEKESMRELAMRGGPFTEAERIALVDYCESDVKGLQGLYPMMLPHIDWPRALLRGRYMKAVARMEFTGVPIDTQLHAELVASWSAIRAELLHVAHFTYGVFPDGSFSTACFARWLAHHDIQWPRTASGTLALDQDTMNDMAQSYPQLRLLHHTMKMLGQFRLTDLAVGRDGRNRTLLSPFRARTSRNQPSTTKYVFGLASWLRSLIRPEPGRALAYLDYGQQEFAIAAVLGGDESMTSAYESGDPYLTFAKQAGAVPLEATKASHKKERDQYKNCALGVQYGMREESLAHRIGQSPAHASALLNAHQKTYPVYWRWSESVVTAAMLGGSLHTVFGWKLQVFGDNVNARSLANFPSQANGAEMLRLACIFATERGVNVCGPVHDAILVEGPEDTIEEVAQEARKAMTEASQVVLSGFVVRVDASIIRWPDRYEDDRGKSMWAIVEPILHKHRK